MRATDAARLQRRVAAGAADQAKLQACMDAMSHEIESHDIAKAIRSLEASALARASLAGQIHAKEQARRREVVREAEYHEDKSREWMEGLKRDALAEEDRRLRAREVRSSIERQLRQREADRIVELELLDQERALTKRQMEKETAEGKRREAALRTEQKRKLAEAQELNELAKQIKAQRKQAEIDEDMRIAELGRARALLAEEEARAREQERQALIARRMATAEKQHKLREDVEAAEQRRIRRAQEQVEMKRRQAERAHKLKKEALQRETLAVLKEQLERKEHLRRMEAEETLRFRETAVDQALTVGLEARDAHDASERTKREYKADLERSMRERSAARKEGRLQPLKERASARLQAIAQTNLLERYKAQTIRRLHGRGVDPTILRDLKKLDIAKAVEGGGVTS
jgi:hypothetical protein